MIVADASRIVEVLLNTPEARLIRKRLFARGEVLSVPQLALAEALDAVLVTCDGAFPSAGGHQARVELF